MPAMVSVWCQQVRGVCIAGKPAPTKTEPRVGAGLPAMASLWCQYLRGACIAGKPAPTKTKPRVGAGLARDGIAGVPVPSRCLHRRQACSNENRASCRSRACPRRHRCGASTFAVLASQASLLQRKPSACRSGLARDGIAGVSVPSRCLYRRQACSNRAAV